MTETNDNQISKYDRKRAGLTDVALWTKPSTVQTHETMTGKSDTFIVATARYEEAGGDFIFVEVIDENREVTRVCLPPRVAKAIARQRESLTTRRRSKAAKERAASMTVEEKDQLRSRLAKARKVARQ